MWGVGGILGGVSLTPPTPVVLQVPVGFGGPLAEGGEKHLGGCGEGCCAGCVLFYGCFPLFSRRVGVSKKSKDLIFPFAESEVAWRPEMRRGKDCLTRLAPEDEEASGVCGEGREGRG